MSWMDRTYLDDLAAEWQDARDEAIRTGQPHPLDCRCPGCVYLEAQGEEPCGFPSLRGPDCERTKPCPRHDPIDYREAV